jgi:hypothetical protein
VLKSVNNDTSFISKLDGFPNGFEVEEFFKVVYNIHATRKTGRIFVYFKLFSMLGIRVDTLKQKPGFMSFLRDNNVFMNMRVFETYAISTVGHVFQRLPEATNCQELKATLEHKIKVAQENRVKNSTTLSVLTLPLIQIEVQSSRVIHLLRDKQGTILEKGDTYAIRVQCERDRIKEVSAILSSGICDDAATGTFVPTTAAMGSPEGYMKLVDEHEEYRKNHSYIRITGLHPDLMNAVILDSSDNNTKKVKEGIMGWKENGSNLVISLEPSLNVLDNGEWRVIVKNTNITTTIEHLKKITTDAERHELFSARVNDSDSFQNGINITSTTIVDTDTMSYVDGLTGRIDATTAANRRAQRISNVAPTASIYLFNDSMSAQGQSQTSSIASRNAWQNPLPSANNKTPIVRNIHQQRGGGLNTDQSGRSGGRGISRENSDMSLTLISDTETLQSQLTRVERNKAAIERLVITQNAKLDRQAAEMKAQKDEIVELRKEQSVTNNNATMVSTLLESLMNRMVDVEQGRRSGPPSATKRMELALPPPNAQKRLQLNTPEQSPAKPPGSRRDLEAPEPSQQKRREELHEAVEDELGRYMEDDEDESETSEEIRATYYVQNEDDDADVDVSMTTPTVALDLSSMMEDDPEDHGPSGKCG